MYRYLFLFVVVISLVSCDGCHQSPEYDPSLPQPEKVPAPQPLSFKITNIYPHDTAAFTQGLEFVNGELLEGTGELRHSMLRKVDLKTGKPKVSVTISDPSIFGEGITVLNNKIYQLTWQNGKVFEYNIDDLATPIATYPWNHEGWGLTNNGSQLIISDGTSQIYFVTPDQQNHTLKVDKTITVRDHTGPKDSINELELVDGQIYANEWMTDNILVIDTTSGHVTKILNLKGLLEQYVKDYQPGPDAVLNGIAYDSATKRFFITGKKWPKLFEMEIQ